MRCKAMVVLAVGAWMALPLASEPPQASPLASSRPTAPASLPPHSPSSPLPPPFTGSSHSERQTEIRFVKTYHTGFRHMAFYRNVSRCSSDQRRTYFKIVDPRGRKFGLNISEEEPLRTFLLPLCKQHSEGLKWLYLREGGEILDLDKNCKEACIREHEIVYVNETIEDLEPEDNYTPTLRMNHDFKSVLDMRLREYGLEDENLCLRGGLDEEQIDEFLGRAGPEMQTLDNKDFDEYYKNRANDMGVPENPDWDDYLNNDDLLKSFTNSDEEKVEIDSHFGVSSSEYESELFKDSFPEENFSDPVYYSPAFPQCGIFGMLIERFDEIIRSEPSSYNHSFLLLRLKNESIDSEIIYASECFMEHFKPPVEDIIGKPWRTLYGHVDKDRLESWQAMNLSGMKLQSRFQYPGKQSHEYACLHAECVLYDHKKRDEVQIIAVVFDDVTGLPTTEVSSSSSSSEVEHDPRDVWDCLAYAENIVLRIRSIMRDSIYDLFPKYHKYVTNFDLGRVQDEIDHEIVGTPIYTSSGGTTESVMNVDVSEQCKVLGDWYRDYHKQLVDAYHERRRQPGPVDTCKVPEELKEQNERMKDTSKKLEEMLLMRKEIQNDANLEDMWEQ